MLERKTLNWISVAKLKLHSGQLAHSAATYSRLVFATESYFHLSDKSKWFTTLHVIQSEAK